jgi:hypothetical protein
VLLPPLPRTRPLAETEERFELEKEEDATQFRSGSTIEIGLEQEHFVVFVYVLPHLNM